MDPNFHAVYLHAEREAELSFMCKTKRVGSGQTARTARADLVDTVYKSVKPPYHRVKMFSEVISSKSSLNNILVNKQKDANRHL